MKLRIPCDICQAELLLTAAPELDAACPVCETRMQVRVFAAAAKESVPGRAGEKLVIDEQSSCFYHPAKKATIACEHCGRFLCSLCDIDMSGRHLCSGCLESSADNNKVVPLINSTMCHDDIALTLAVAPLFVLPAAIVTAPVAIGYSLWSWRKPRALVNRGRWRLVAAILVALFEIGFWATVFWGMPS